MCHLFDILMILGLLGLRFVTICVVHVKTFPCSLLKGLKHDIRKIQWRDHNNKNV